MFNVKVAVAMSVYKSDNAVNLERSLESIFSQVEVEPYVYLQVDGPVSKDVSTVIHKFSNNHNLYPSWHKTNLGLASRLNNAIEIILDNDFDYIARMDADDICFVDRFIKQLNFLNVNPDIDVVGTDVIEISDSGHEIFHKKMDAKHDDLIRKIIKKCPFNHPSVMSRTSIFKEGFRYKAELMNTQDYYLWIDLLAAGKKFANLNEPLLYFRVDDDFHNRRGLKKAINDFKSRIYAFKKLNIYNPSNILHVVMLFLLRLSPAFIKKAAYKFLR